MIGEAAKPIDRKSAEIASPTSDFLDEFSERRLQSTPMSQPENRHRLVWVDKRPSAGINMRLLSVNRGAIHGYRYDSLQGVQHRGTKASCSARSPHLG